MTKIGCRALELNCCRIELLVEINNPARTFYEKFGFSETADRVYSITIEVLKGTGKMVCEELVYQYQKISMFCTENKFFFEK